MRTTIEVPINYSADEATARLRDFFGAHGYVALQCGSQTLMRSSSSLWYIFPQVLPDKVILQGFIGKPGRFEKGLDGFYGVALKAPARNALGELQQILSCAPVSAQGLQNSGRPAQSDPSPAAYIPAPDTLAEKNAGLAIWSILIGVAACLIALAGLALGAIIIIVGIWLGCAALKTSKRTLAIIGIVFNALSVVINLLTLLT